VKSGPLDYFAREAARTARTAPWLTAVSVLTVAIALVLVGLFAMVFFNASRLIGELGQSLSVNIYIKDAASSEDVAVAEKLVRQRQGVHDVRVLTPDMDRARNKALLDPTLLEGLDEEAIPGQAVIEAELDTKLQGRADVEELVSWARTIEAVQNVDDVSFGAEKLRLLFAVVEISRTVGTVLSIALLAGALFFVFSTIRLAVYARREEIEILRIVGATDAFIRAPFYIGGAAQGLLGALLAMAFLALLHVELRGLVHEVYLLNVSWSLMPPKNSASPLWKQRWKARWPLCHLPTAWQ